jgi:Protein of unknown function (DUF2393)
MPSVTVYNRLVNQGPQLVRPAAPSDRNWIPLAVAAATVVAVAILLLVVFQHGKSEIQVTPINAPLDPYAAHLPISNLSMSVSRNFLGGKITYLDGHIVNSGSRTVTAITVQVLFHDVAGDVVQNVTQPLQLIRTRQPYVDVEPVSAEPLKPGQGHDFRLTFDTVADSWNNVMPEVRIVHVDTR